MYKYRVKGKELTFDTSKLNDKDKLRWEKLGKIGKLRMIESYNLNDKSGVPGDYIDVKTVKDKPQNERLAKLRIEEQKKSELDKIKQRMNLTKDDELQLMEDVMIDEEKLLLGDDIKKITDKNPNATISDLEKVYVDKIEQLTANEIGTINAKNIDTINASNVNKLLFDVKKLTDDLVNPLRPVLENLIERHGDDRHVLELADKNDIQGLMDELRRLNDNTTINEIKDSINSLKLQVDLLTGIDTDIATIYGMTNENSNQLNEILDKIKNEPNPIKRMDEIKSLESTGKTSDSQFEELKKMIEKLMNEQLTKEQVQEIINDESLFEDLKKELKTEYGEEADKIINKIDIEESKEMLNEIKSILSTKEDITIDEIKTALKEDREALIKELDEILKTKFEDYKNIVLPKTKLSDDKENILKGIFNDLVNKYPDEFKNIAKGELSDDKFKDILKQTYDRMKQTLISSLNNLRRNINSNCVIGVSDGDTRSEGNYRYYRPYISFDDDNWDTKLIKEIEENTDLRILSSNNRISSSQLSTKYKAYDDLMEMLNDFVVLNPSVKTVSGSIFSKIKDKITNKKGYDELKNEVEDLKSEVNKLKQEMESIKKVKAQEQPKRDISKQPEQTKNNFLNDIIKHKDLKHVEQIKNDYIPDEGIIGNLKDIMKKRREDIEPDEYSEDEIIDWAAGLRKPKYKILSYNEFKELMN